MRCGLSRRAGWAVKFPATIVDVHRTKVVAEMDEEEARIDPGGRRLEFGSRGHVASSRETAMSAPDGVSHSSVHPSRKAEIRLITDKRYFRVAGRNSEARPVRRAVVNGYHRLRRVLDFGQRSQAAKGLLANVPCQHDDGDVGVAHRPLTVATTWSLVPESRFSALEVPQPRRTSQDRLRLCG